ncbi:MAG: DUF4163 domain-containing protein [Novosphingobium sp.]
MRVLLLTPLALLVACSGEKAPAPASSTEPAVAAAILPEPPAQTPVTAREVHEKNELYEFDYSYPASAGAVPGLKALLDQELEAARSKLKAEASEGQKAAKEAGFPYHPYTHSAEWKVVTDLPAWLSLSTLVGDYSGGAHPNYGFATVLWDRIAGKRRAPVDLFASKAALAGAIRTAFCRELDRQRARKRAGSGTGNIAEFSECIDPTDQTVILGSSNGKAFDRIGILVSPYAAGPYVEGDYEVTVPVTQKVLDVVRPEFKAAFVAG